MLEELEREEARIRRLEELEEKREIEELEKLRRQLAQKAGDKAMLEEEKRRQSEAMKKYPPPAPLCPQLDWVYDKIFVFRMEAEGAKPREPITPLAKLRTRPAGLVSTELEVPPPTFYVFMYLCIYVFMYLCIYVFICRRQ